MATIILSAVGTAIGGPIGGTIGTLIGSQIDAAIFGPGDREGPRLDELSVTTSSYGAAMPRHFGTMRAAGSIIWATDLAESSEDVGGGKGRPSTTTYSYSTSFAVALASRPIQSVGRIWADGNLLRGAAGDLKVGGAFRLYSGLRDQNPDPLIAASEGAQAPAFRGIAYCVFEDLQLSDFGNRIPALTFEIIADSGEVSLQSLLSPVDQPLTVEKSLPALHGYSDKGGPLRSALDAVDRAYPFVCDNSANGLTIIDGHPDVAPSTLLPEAAIDASADSFGGTAGTSRQARADKSQIPTGMRYYDVERDFQPGLQRAGGQAQKGRNRILEFPGALHATTARNLADEAALRASWSQDRVAYRIAEIDPALGPGQTVSIPDKPGKWRIEAWEWRETGLELELLRLPYQKGVEVSTDAGRALTPRDAVSGATLLTAFELPWDGSGSSDEQHVFAAASSSASGWTGATLYADSSGSLAPIGGTGARRSISGQSANTLPGSKALFIDRFSHLDVQLHSTDFVLVSALPEDIAQGANRALLGEEIIQFCDAEHLGSGLWRLSGLLRGRGGTEHVAGSPIAAGAPFVLLDGKPVPLDAAEIGNSGSIAAIGIADEDPVIEPIINLGAGRQPLCPVHPSLEVSSNGDWTMCWTRRARGAWGWQGTVEVPLNEQVELYEVGVGSPELPQAVWQVDTPRLSLNAATIAQLIANFSGSPIWVRQIGTHARSHPLLITTLA